MKTKPNKKSTLLLLSIVMMLLSLYTTYIIVINQKLVSKDFSYINNNKAEYTRIKFESQKVVVLKGLLNCIVLTSDSIRLDMFNEDVKRVDAKRTKDTVTIIVNQGMASKTFLYLPTGTQLVADSSSFEMRGSFDYKRQPEYLVTLLHSTLLVSSGDGHTHFGKLSVTDLDGSHLKIGRYVHINELELLNVHDATFAQGWQISNLKTAFNSGAEVQLGKYKDSVSIRTKLPVQR